MSSLLFVGFQVHGDLTINQNYLVEALPAALQVFLHDALWDSCLVSDGFNPPQVILVPWEKDKWMFRDVSDFQLPEAFWLTTYGNSWHNQQIQNADIIVGI